MAQKIDPKKTEQVKKGINLSKSNAETGKKLLTGGTTAKAVVAAIDVPVFDKTKGGVPTNPTDADKFFTGEIKRHEGLLKKFNDLRNSVASNTPEYKAYEKKTKQVLDAMSFLSKQQNALIEKVGKKEREQMGQEMRDSLKTRTAMDVIKQKITSKGSGYVGM